MLTQSPLFIYYTVYLSVLDTVSSSMDMAVKACPTHEFNPNVQIECSVFPHAPHDAPFLRILAMDMIDYTHTYNLTNQLSLHGQPVNPFYINVQLVPATPAYVTVQDPSSSFNFDRLVGIALDGIPIFSGLSSSGVDVFDPVVGADFSTYSLDACGGTYGPTPFGWRYHYRTMPTCIKDSTDSRSKREIQISDIHELLESFIGIPPSILGYSITGYPIFSPYTSRGLLQSGLDNCNGKFVNGTYGYYVTPRFPYVLGCDGPGVYSSLEQGVTLENIPSTVGINYLACPGGSYPSVNFESNGCVLCPAGKFSSRSFVWTSSTAPAPTAACEQQCPLGHYCPEGSTKPIKCPAGRYGMAMSLGTNRCSGDCAAGYFCPPASTVANTLPCGNITYYCPAGTPQRFHVDPAFYSIPQEVPEFYRIAQLPCEPGTYCVDAKRALCPSGTYGATYNLASTQCTALCPPGNYCPQGSVQPTLCPAGRFGSDSGLTNSSCSGSCSPGYWCPAGSTSSKQKACAPGMYGAEFGLATAECSPLCEVGGGPNSTTSAGTRFCAARISAAGYTCPAASTSATQVPCGGPGVFCPPGAVVPTPVDSGYYSVGPLSAPGEMQKEEDALVRTAQVQCEPGYYCTGGLRFACPRGYYGGDVGISNAMCSGQCDPGYICDYASPSPRQYACGGDPSVYCPRGSYQNVSSYTLVSIFVCSGNS